MWQCWFWKQDTTMRIFPVHSGYLSSKNCKLGEIRLELQNCASRKVAATAWNNKVKGNDSAKVDLEAQEQTQPPALYCTVSIVHASYFQYSTVVYCTPYSYILFYSYTTVCRNCTFVRMYLLTSTFCSADARVYQIKSVPSNKLCSILLQLQQQSTAIASYLCLSDWRLRSTTVT